MSEVCPFCGNKVTWRFEHSNGLNLNFACETALRDSGKWIRGEPCYEAELTALKSQLNEWQQKCQSLAAHAVMDEERLAEEEDLLKKLADLGVFTVDLAFKEYVYGLSEKAQAFLKGDQE